MEVQNESMYSRAFTSLNDGQNLPPLEWWDLSDMKMEV